MMTVDEFVFNQIFYLVFPSNGHTFSESGNICNATPLHVSKYWVQNQTAECASGIDSLFPRKRKAIQCNRLEYTQRSEILVKVMHCGCLTLQEGLSNKVQTAISAADGETKIDDVGLAQTLGDAVCIWA